MPSKSEQVAVKSNPSLRVAYASAALNVVLMTMQTVIGSVAHSDALLADGIHTLSDLAVDGVVLAVLHFGATAAGLGRTHHAQRLETMGSLLISAVLVATGLEMLWRGFGNLTDGVDGPAVQMSALFVAVLVIAAKEALFRYMMAAAQRSASSILLASAWHARSDAISAIVATLGVAGSLAGMATLDQAAAMIIGTMIVYMGCNISWTTFKAWPVRA
jgi:cation diffusion facilitator family transporter